MIRSSVYARITDPTMSVLIPAYAVAADGVPAYRAVAQSIRAMSRQFFPAVSFVFSLGLLFTLVGTLTCLLGMLAFVPMSCIISALAYRDIVGMPPTVYRDGAPNHDTQSWPPAPFVD